MLFLSIFLIISWKWKCKAEVLVAQSCPTLCDPMVFSPPGSSVRGILQARILEWVAIPFSSIISYMSQTLKQLNIFSSFFLIVRLFNLN